MKERDFILDRIYQKVITSDCYEHFYKQISDEDISKAKLFVYITPNDAKEQPRNIYINPLTLL